MKELAWSKLTARSFYKGKKLCPPLNPEDLSEFTQHTPVKWILAIYDEISTTACVAIRVPIDTTTRSIRRIVQPVSEKNFLCYVNDTRPNWSIS